MAIPCRSKCSARRSTGGARRPDAGGFVESVERPPLVGTAAPLRYTKITCSNPWRLRDAADARRSVARGGNSPGRRSQLASIQHVNEESCSRESSCHAHDVSCTRAGLCSVALSIAKGNRTLGLRLLPASAARNGRKGERAQGPACWCGPL